MLLPGKTRLLRSGLGRVKGNPTDPRTSAMKRYQPYMEWKSKESVLRM
jgi:hypothetical protein